MKKILVIIPTAQPLDYFRECLNSIFSQTLVERLFDVLIVLNGPREPFYEGIQKQILNRQNIILNYSEEKGVSFARNIGVEYAIERKYEYICFVDDDDILSATYLEGLYKNRNDLVVSNVYYFKNEISERKSGYLTKAYRNGIKGNIFLNRKYFSSPWMKMVKVQCIGDVRYPNIPKSEDAVFFARISKNINSISKSPSDAIYYVRRRKESVSRKRTSISHRLRYYSSLSIKYYLPLLFNMKYNSLFILSRIVASFIHVFRRIKY